VGEPFDIDYWVAYGKHGDTDKEQLGRGLAILNFVLYGRRKNIGGKLLRSQLDFVDWSLNLAKT
jgi:hypothetical protein